jgi:hypothetical protein
LTGAQKLRGKGVGAADNAGAIYQQYRGAAVGKERLKFGLCGAQLAAQIRLTCSGRLQR